MVEAELLRLVRLEKEVEQMATAVEYAKGLATALQRADVPRVGKLVFVGGGVGVWCGGVWCGWVCV